MEQRVQHEVEDNTVVLRWSSNLNLSKEIAYHQNPAYSCFTFGKVDLTYTIEEYRALICCPRSYEDRVYIKPPNTASFKKKVLLLTGMSREWATRDIKKKGDSECITWTSLKEVIYRHPEKRKMIDMLALGIYGLDIFPKILRHVDISTVDLFERLNKNAYPAPAILAETFHSLNSCRHEGEGRFIGCAPVLLVWILNHFKHEERTPGRVVLEDFSTLQDFLSRKWTGGYAHLMVSRQYESRQFIPGTSGLSKSEFAFRSDQYKEKIRKVDEVWKWIHRVNLFTFSQKLSQEYEQWRVSRVNDNIPMVNFENVQPIKEHLRIIPSSLELSKQDFEIERKQLKITLQKLEEESYHKEIEIDTHKGRADQVSKVEK
ncbi:uncharacterized protein LOC120174058 [Hibiscus syriacus]|uniref:uncharacterized protein LOC120174058 n=1 Tax=Hibiscus syriacus TaxID=106335 RepID=UPI0019232E15|nr:uncharacterized protein LOC120174058 [Hibiscus syriacus]